MKRNNQDTSFGLLTSRIKHDQKKLKKQNHSVYHHKSCAALALNTYNPPPTTTTTSSATYFHTPLPRASTLLFSTVYGTPGYSPSRKRLVKEASSFFPLSLRVSISLSK